MILNRRGSISSALSKWKLRMCVGVEGALGLLEPWTQALLYGTNEMWRQNFLPAQYLQCTCMQAGQKCFVGGMDANVEH